MSHSALQAPPKYFQEDDSMAASCQKSAIFSPSELEARTLILTTVSPISSPEVCESHPKLDHQEISEVFAKMAKAGELRRAAHGIYIRPGDPLPTEEEIQALRQKHSKPRKRRDTSLLKFLERARSSIEMQERFSVSRQYIDQKTKTLMREGILYRLRFAGAWHYATSMQALEQAAKRHGSALDCVESDILNALPCRGPVDSETLCEEVGLSWETVTAHLESLLQQGLADLRVIRASPFIAITPRGLKHFQREHSVPRRAESVFRDRFGKDHTDILWIVDLLGPLEAQDIRYCLEAMDPAYTDMHIPGILARMRTRGFLAHKRAKGRSRRAYSLGPMADEVMDWVKLHAPEASRETLSEAITEGHRRTNSMARKNLMGHGSVL
jgi:DNA-binding MarR family transcriptional regulator